MCIEHKKTDYMKSVFKSLQLTMAMVPSSCTSLVQPLDVCMNKSFKDRVKEAAANHYHSNPTKWTDIPTSTPPFPIENLVDASLPCCWLSSSIAIPCLWPFLLYLTQPSSCPTILIDHLGHSIGGAVGEDLRGRGGGGSSETTGNACFLLHQHDSSGALAVVQDQSEYQ